EDATPPRADLSAPLNATNSFRNPYSMVCVMGRPTSSTPICCRQGGSMPPQLLLDRFKVRDEQHDRLVRRALAESAQDRGKPPAPAVNAAGDAHRLGARGHRFA